MDKTELKKYAYILIGGFIFAIGVNLFIVPINLYSGGIIGIAQIMRTLCIQNLGLNIPSNIDIAGILNFLINIPLFFMAYRSISRRFFIGTLLCVIAQTVSFTIIPIPAVPIIDDMLCACIIGGLISGFGIGIALRSGGSGGGLDILGVYFTKKFENFSVGRLSIFVNIVVYVFCAFIFDVPTAIYSVVYMICFSMMLDRTHYQNINMTAMIFTKNEQVQESIMKETGRGVTFWKGAGAYTRTDTYVLVTVISKYEVSQLKRIIYGLDEKAFVIFNEGMSISGNFEKRL